MIKRVPEILAPAGNAETALAAFDAGADAVYCGLGRFNARERAENFTVETLHSVIDYAHERSKRVYLTFNTLLFESELADAAAMLNDLVRLAPDALIVQDPGVMVMIHRYFPELALHFSTQAGIHNSAGVAAAARFGAGRVILERQLSLDELRRIAASAKVELEVFIHGSLCCSLSGRCLLSEELNGASGNRGRCKQPCRMRYGNEYPLSPADLCGIDLLPELCRLGIASLKIEGRLRPPEYIWKTTHAYRMLLDASPGDYAAVRAEAETLLNSASGRGFSHGFYCPAEWSGLIDPKRRGAFGIAVAEVTSRSRRGLAVAVTSRLHLGDRLRPVSADGRESGDSFSLTSLEMAEKAVLCVPSGKRCFLPGISGAEPGWIIYKIGENGFDFSRRARTLPPGRFAVDLNIELTAEHCRVGIVQLDNWHFETACAFAKAERRAATENDLETAFRSGSPQGWKAGNVRVELEAGLFVPASELKKLRRAFWSAAEAELGKFRFPDPGLRKFLADYGAMPESGNAAAVPADYEIPAFIPEAELERERKRLREAWNSGARRIGVTGWHAAEMLREFPEAETILEFPFPVTNSFATQALPCCTGCFAAPELPRSELAALQAHSPVPVGRGKAAPLLVTRLDLHVADPKFRTVRRQYVTELLSNRSEQD